MTWRRSATPIAWRGFAIVDLLFIENVGNLICPVCGGDDEPAKHPHRGSLSNAPFPYEDQSFASRAVRFGVVQKSHQAIKLAGNTARIVDIVTNGSEAMDLLASAINPASPRIRSYHQRAVRASVGKMRMRNHNRCAMTRFHPSRSILAAIRSVPVPPKPPAMAYDAQAKPFVTISREPGAGATGVGRGLVDALNCDCPDEQRWTLWDRELVGKVAVDHNLSARLVEGLLESNHSWMTNFLTSLSFADSSQVRDEDAIYQKVKKMIQALASAGRVVIVGRGAVFITGHVPDGIHLRLVAPLKDRVNFMAQKLDIDQRAAAAHIRELEKNRRTFFKMHWPNKTLAPASFTITINTAEVDTASIVEMLRRLIAVKVAATGQ